MEKSTNLTQTKQELTIKETLSIGSYAVVIVVLSWGLGFFWGKSHPEKFRWGTWLGFRPQTYSAPSPPLARKQNSAPAKIAEPNKVLLPTPERSGGPASAQNSDTHAAPKPSEQLAQVVNKHLSRSLTFLPLETLDSSLKTHTFVFLEQLNTLKDQENVEVSFGIRKLFPPGQATLNQNAQGEFQFLVKAIAHFGRDSYIDVESYADSIPVVKNRNLYPSNWELSTARASAVVKGLISLGIPPEKIRIIGYGDGQAKAPTRSIASQTDPRMIRLRLRNKPF